MKLLILSASPKKKGGASRFFSRLFRLFLPGVRKKVVSLSSRRDFQQILELFPDMDAVCLFVPLYVDSLPSHVVEFLIQAEEYCKVIPCRFRLYAFFQQRLCRGKTKSTRPAYASGMVQKGGDHLGRRNRNRRRNDASSIGDRLPDPNWNHPVANGVILFQHRHRFRRIVAFPCYPDIHMAFLNSGVLFCMARLSSAIRRERMVADQFTRVMIPSFLFIPVADIFMILSSLFHGRFLFALLKRDEWHRQ